MDTSKENFSTDMEVLDDQLIHQLYQTMRAFSKTLNNEIFMNGVYSSEWSVLKMVREHEAISQLELANALNVEPAAISKTLTKMEKKNLVERQRLPGKREKYISLTTYAQKLYLEIEPKVAKHRTLALNDLSKEERQTMLKLAQRIYKNTLNM